MLLAVFLAAELNPFYLKVRFLYNIFRRATFCLLFPRYPTARGILLGCEVWCN